MWWSIASKAAASSSSRTSVIFIWCKITRSFHLISVISLLSWHVSVWLFSKTSEQNENLPEVEITQNIQSAPPLPSSCSLSSRGAPVSNSFQRNWSMVGLFFRIQIKSRHKKKLFSFPGFSLHLSPCFVCQMTEFGIYLYDHANLAHQRLSRSCMRL